VQWRRPPRHFCHHPDVRAVRSRNGGVIHRDRTSQSARPSTKKTGRLGLITKFTDLNWGPLPDIQEQGHHREVVIMLRRKTAVCGSISKSHRPDQAGARQSARHLGTLQIVAQGCCAGIASRSHFLQTPQGDGLQVARNFSPELAQRLGINPRTCSRTSTTRTRAMRVSPEGSGTGLRGVLLPDG
jgi:hypothetical protein